MSEQYIIIDSCTESKWRMEAGSTSGELALYLIERGIEGWKDRGREGRGKRD